MPLDRRGFLKGMALLTAGSQLDIFDLTNKFFREDYTLFGEWRAVCQRDLRRGFYVVRYDILTKQGIGLGVDAQFAFPLTEVDDYREKIHKPMVTVLENEIKHRKIKRGDLISLPNLHHGFENPPGFNKLIAQL